MRRRRFGMLKVMTFVSVALGILLLGELTQAMAESWLVNEENAMTQQVNQHRASIGVQPLSENAGWKMVARRQAQRMVMAGKIYHNPNIQKEADQAIPDWLLIGENVGVGPDEPSVEQAFLNSPHHRENIEEPDYNIIGMGAMAADDGEMYFTQTFAQIEHTRAPAKKKTKAKTTPKTTKKPVAPAQPVVRKTHVPPLVHATVKAARATARPVPVVKTSSTPEPAATPTVLSSPPAAPAEGTPAPSSGSQSVNLFNGLAAMVGEALRKIGHALSKLAFWR